MSTDLAEPKPRAPSSLFVAPFGAALEGEEFGEVEAEEVRGAGAEQLAAGGPSQVWVFVSGDD